mmetsp:Transcript_11243/g.17959  ORF Transcript_11243/g.17959 Transcript_11243/m.17959 type:complete len:99 (+) Transcript_11243:109-405(+)
MSASLQSLSSSHHSLFPLQAVQKHGVQCGGVSAPAASNANCLYSAPAASTANCLDSALLWKSATLRGKAQISRAPTAGPPTARANAFATDFAFRVTQV